MAPKEREVELDQLFRDVKALLTPYAQHFSVRMDRPHRYELWSEKAVVIAGRKRKEVFFASIIVQSNYLGFYFMPVYADKDLEKVFSPLLCALKRGKSCFHLKNSEHRLLEDLRTALKAGYGLYLARNWVEKP